MQDGWSPRLPRWFSPRPVMSRTYLRFTEHPLPLQCGYMWRLSMRPVMTPITTTKIVGWFFALSNSSQAYLRVTTGASQDTIGQSRTETRSIARARARSDRTAVEFGSFPRDTKRYGRLALNLSEQISRWCFRFLFLFLSARRSLPACCKAKCPSHRKSVAPWHAEFVANIGDMPILPSSTWLRNFCADDTTIGWHRQSICDQERIVSHLFELGIVKIRRIPFGNYCSHAILVNFFA